MPVTPQITQVILVGGISPCNLWNTSIGDGMAQNKISAIHKFKIIKLGTVLNLRRRKIAHNTTVFPAQPSTMKAASERICEGFVKGLEYWLSDSFSAMVDVNDTPIVCGK